LHLHFEGHNPDDHGCCHVVVPSLTVHTSAEQALDMPDMPVLPVLTGPHQLCCVCPLQVRQLREALRARAATPPTSVEVNAALQVCSCFLAYRPTAPQPSDIVDILRSTVHCNEITVCICERSSPCPSSLSTLQPPMSAPRKGQSRCCSRVTGCLPMAGRFQRLTQWDPARRVQLQKDLGHVMVIHIS
jgi:hypothetical protein